MLLSEYAQKLPASARSRYEEKVLMCGVKDPLSLLVDETVTDTSAYPKVQECDVKDNLAGKTSFITREQFKAHTPASLRQTDKQWNKFLDDAQASNLRPAFLSLVDGYAESYKPTAGKYKSALLFKECVTPPWEDVSEKCDKLASDIREV
ncbi:hypothetical protein HPB47_019124 [Ixodes persulcatus]|uniref:Uncharacterized protein n=1 Tax=Ixodes persulcatus TaxID=34615 RepID=A0AC60QLL1_IXOPE|nr:hypothetical protein HPB47_019124 [Ixodes persulcatus]